jgi:hypothetical protein
MTKRGAERDRPKSHDLPRRKKRRTNERGKEPGNSPPNAEESASRSKTTLVPVTNLLCVSWNVGGVATANRIDRLEKWISHHQPDIIALQETKTRSLELSVEVARAYTIFQSPGEEITRIKGDENEPSKRREITTRARKRGLAILVKRRDDIEWVREGAEEEGQWEMAVIALFKPTGTCWRFINAYGPQAADVTSSNEQFKRLAIMTKVKIGGKAVPTLWMADMNESDREHGATKDSLNVDALKSVIAKLGMVRISCADANGVQTTNKGTNGQCRGAPDWIVADKSQAHNTRTEIIHTNRISAHSHEPIHVWLYADAHSNGRSKPWTQIRRARNEDDKDQGAISEQKRHNMRPRRWTTPTEVERAAFDEKVRLDRKEWRVTLSKNLADAREEMYKIINAALDTRGERKTPRRWDKNQTKGGSAVTKSSRKHAIRHSRTYDMPPGDRWDTLWRKLTTPQNGNRGNQLPPLPTRKDWREYQDENQNRTKREANLTKKVRNGVTKAMKGRIRRDPKFVWDAIRRADRVPRVRAPTAIWTKDEQGRTHLLCRPDEVQGVWEEAFTRDTQPQEGTSWDEAKKDRVHRELEAFLMKLKKTTTRETLRDEVEQWDWTTLTKKAHRVLKDVGTGPANITGKMMKEAGPEVLSMVDEFVREVVTMAELPDEMSMDERIPVFKRENAAIPTNFRPVSLSDEDSKMTLAIVREKMMEWINGPTGPGAHPNSFGSKKGRDRTIALWCIKATVRHEQIVSNGTAVIAIVIADAKSAFPTLWRENLAMKLLRWGMPVAIWRRWWATVRNLHGYIKIADIVTRITLYIMGVNQGSILAADEWSWYIQDIPDVIGREREAREEFAMEGTTPSTIHRGTLKGEKGNKEEETTPPIVPFVSYVDDTTSILRAPRGGGRVGEHVMKGMDEYARKNRINWAKKKTKMLIVRPPKDRKTKRTPATKWHTKLAGTTTENEESIKVLGEHIDETLYQSKKQFESTMNAARRAGENIKWLCADESGTLAELLKTLLTTLVMSRIRIGLAMSKITEKQTSKIDVMMAKIIKDAAGLSQRTPARVALAWIGVRTARTELEHEVLRIYGRIRTRAAGKLAHETYERRIRQLNEGRETQGLLATVREIVGDNKEMLSFWNKTNPWSDKELERWKKAIARRCATSEKESWLEWLKKEKNGGTHNNRIRSSMPEWPEHGVWKVIAHLDRRQQARYIACMTGALGLRANRGKERTRDPTSDESCRLCQKGKEDEWHMLNTCEDMKEARTRMWRDAGLTGVGPNHEDMLRRHASLFAPCRRHHDSKMLKRRVNALSVFLSELAAKMAIRGVELVQKTWKDDEMGRMTEDESVLNANAQGFANMRLDDESWTELKSPGFEGQN